MLCHLFFRRSMFVAFLLMGCWGYCHADVVRPVVLKPIGEVVWVKGQVTDAVSEKSSRLLKRKDLIYEGDTLSTAVGGGGQIVFSDGSLLALRENTIFKINRYQYDQKGSPAGNKFIANLVKGGFRTITGAISKGHPENYRLETPVATIGVRGTEFSGFCGKVCDFKWGAGIVTIHNGFGELVLNDKTRYGEVPVGKGPVAVVVPPVVFASDPALVYAKPSPTLISSSVANPSVGASPGSSVGAPAAAPAPAGGASSGGVSGKPGGAPGGTVSDFSICP